jgi:hypothetical protein
MSLCLCTALILTFFLAEAIPSTVGAAETTDTIATENVEEVEDVDNIGEVSSKLDTDHFAGGGVEHVFEIRV